MILSLGNISLSPWSNGPVSFQGSLGSSTSSARAVNQHVKQTFRTSKWATGISLAAAPTSATPMQLAVWGAAMGWQQGYQPVCSGPSWTTDGEEERGIPWPREVLEQPSYDGNCSWKQFGVLHTVSLELMADLCLMITSLLLLLYCC